MAKISVTLTKDMITLISNFRFQKYEMFEDSEEKETRHEIYYGLDLNSLYGGSFLFENISYLIGLYDKHIPETEESPMGVDFPNDIKDYMWVTHRYILDNLEYIEQILHQFACRGGLTEGTYTCKSNEMLWTKID